MNTQPFYDIKAREWPMLLTYNIYRLINIVLLSLLFWVDAFNHINPVYYFGTIVFYLIFGLFFLCLWYLRKPKFVQQVLISGTIDTIVMSFLIYVIGYLQSGLGVLLNVLIAMLSILVPGRLAIFFAAVASSMLLGISFFEYQYHLKMTLNLFFSTGIYGAGFFATALTAWYFANWVRVSENLASTRARELYSLQQLNEYIVDRLQYGVIYVDTDSSVKVINTAARQFFNYHQANVKLYDLSPVLNQKYKQFLTQKKKNKRMLHIVLDKPYLQVDFLPASLAEEQAVLIILDDMATLAQQAQQLKLASLGQFSASIAHELRNPLAVVSHAVQLIQDSHDLNQEDARLIQLIISNCHRMNTVIQNVLQVSRRHQAKPEPIALTSFLNQFKREYRLINLCAISLHIPQNKKKTVIFDRGHLEQVLVIICDNAMEHGRDAQGKVNITMTLRHEGRQMILMICDQGPGISAELRERVFEPFFSSIKTGTGMGLFIARDLCEINQAQLAIMETEKGCCLGILFNQNHEI